jgi:uncharacterized DUF497 family protein
MYFEWDEKKNKANIQKHFVSFDSAKLIFDDLHLLSVLDDRYSYEEERWHSMGSAMGLVILFVAHTARIDKNGEEVIRIISARKAKEIERKRYLQNHT